MDTLTLEVSVPKDLLAALGFSRAYAAEQVKEFTVLGLYRERRISAGKAAEMLGLHLGEFVRLLARKDVQYFDYPDEELARELRAAAAWKREDDPACSRRLERQSPALRTLRLHGETSLARRAARGVGTGPVLGLAPAAEVGYNLP